MNSAPAELDGRDRADVTAGPSPEQTYQALLDEGRFLIQRCGACGAHVFHPRLVCPKCGARHLDWVEPSGLGCVYSTTVVRRPAEKGGPYNVVLVDLDEGVRLMSRVEGIEPDRVAIGQRVRSEVVVQDGAGLLVFRCEGEPA